MSFLKLSNEMFFSFSLDDRQCLYLCIYTGLQPQSVKWYNKEPEGCHWSGVPLPEVKSGSARKDPLQCNHCQVAYSINKM